MKVNLKVWNGPINKADRVIWVEDGGGSLCLSVLPHLADMKENNFLRWDSSNRIESMTQGLMCIFWVALT